jgi:hypothetical protein
MSRTVKILQRNFLWILFIGFSVFAVYSRQDAHVFLSESAYPYGKYAVWLIFIAFFGYSFYSGLKENFFKTLKTMINLYWGRQIGLDLYIGLIFSATIIGIHGGIWVLLIWILPILIYANLATLLYFALNYDSIINHFMM